MDLFHLCLGVHLCFYVGGGGGGGGFFYVVDMWKNHSLVLNSDPPPKRKGRSGASLHHGLAVTMDSATLKLLARLR